MSAVDVFAGLGEILWDLFPEGRRLGGAPANFAFHSAQLGRPAAAISRAGDDLLGREILDRLAAAGLSADAVQIDPVHPTGTVRVDLDAQGQPAYTIVEGVAWDHLEWTPALAALAARTAAVCFGSLAQRHPVSRETIRRFLTACPPETFAVFDINLRQSFHGPEVIHKGLELARAAKMNDEELPVVAGMTGLESESEEDRARELLERYALDLVCVTRGARGALLVTEDAVSDHPGFPVEVADAVGAGDAFVAALAHHWIKGSPLDRINEAANRMGAFVAGQSGATPALPPALAAELR